MQISELDSEYINIVKDILSNEEFLKLKECEHHGMNRFDHSLRVSYMAYNYAKKNNLDIEIIARGALLHDFFITDKMNPKEKITSIFKHPNKAYINANNFYNIGKIETDIILSHMFPFGLKIPRYKESWIVSMCDKKVAFSEFGTKFNFSFKYATNLSLLLLLNFIK